MPTLRLFGPLAISLRIRDRPGNGAADSDLLSFPVECQLLLAHGDVQVGGSLTDHPCQTRFDRRDRLIEVVTVQAHASFQTETVASSKSNQLNIGLRGDFLRDSDGVLRRNGHLST